MHHVTMGVSVAQRSGGHWPFDLMVMGSILGQGVIRAPRATQPSIPLGLENRVPVFNGWS